MAISTVSIGDMYDFLFNRNKDEIRTIVSFALLVGWIISFPYEGPVFYALTVNGESINPSINSFNLLLLATGLLLGIFITVRSNQIRNILIWLKITCLMLSLALFIIPAKLWIVVIPLISFGAGIGMSLYGHQIKAHVSKSGLISVAPVSMVLACLVVIGAQFLLTAASVKIAFIFIELVLAISIVVLMKTDEVEESNHAIRKDSFSGMIKKFWLLLLFIYILTINAGIMFHVIFPAFSEYIDHSILYTNIPYVAAIIYFSIFYRRNKFNALFVGLALWGISLLVFSHFSPSVLFYIFLTSTMLFASGIFDLFWWTIFTTSFDYVKNPSTMFGSILSVNVFGSLTGGVLSKYMIGEGLTPFVITQLGLLTIMVCMVLIVPLSKRISPFLSDSDFFAKQRWNDEDDIDAMVSERLSSREAEVYQLLLTGISDKEIGSHLNISLNTVKSHNRKIYSKLDVRNRIELKKHYKMQTIN